MKSYRAFWTIALLLLAGTAFGQSVAIHSWGRAMLVPAMGGLGTADVPAETLGTSWQTSPRVGVTLSGTSKFLGFSLALTADNAVVNDDGAYLWVKPLDKTTIYLGQYNYDGLRGNGVFSSFDWLRVLHLAGEDLTFARAGRSSTYNTVVVSEPVEHLTVFADVQNGHTYDEAWKTMQYGAAYEIPDVGQIRGQYIGSTTTNGQQINAMVRMTAVSGLTLDVGGFLPVDPTVTHLKLGGYAKYEWDAATFHLLGFLESPQALPQQMELGLGADFDIAYGLRLTSDFRYQDRYRHAALSGTDLLNGAQSAFVGILQSYANGLFGIGIQYCTTSFETASWYTGAMQGVSGFVDDPTKQHWAVPVRVEYWF